VGRRKAQGRRIWNFGLKRQRADFRFWIRELKFDGEMTDQRKGGVEKAVR
jgi:hypothetical protein